MSQSPTAYSITLPVEPDQLGLFVSGLLGKPQTISRSIRGPFRVTRADIEDVHELIEQRLSSQNRASLVGFSAKIVYNDASSVLLNSFLQFKTYNEVKPLTSQAIHLSWIYLIQFNNRSVPEKQQIDLSIVTNRDRASYLEIDTEIIQRIVEKGADGVMQLRISHTDRSWGADLDALLTGRLEHLLIRLTGMKQFVAKNAGWIGFATALCLFAVLAYGVYYASDQVHTQHVESVTTSGRTIEFLVSRIDHLSGLIASGIANKFVVLQVVYLLVSVAAAVVAGVVVGALAAQDHHKGILVITRKDEEKSKLTADSDLGFVHFLVSAPVSLCLGVLANYLFFLLSRWLAL